MKNRCPWAGNDPIYIKYHDKEWGVPLHDDRKLFEFLLLDGFQAGLSWITILKKRIQICGPDNMPCVYAGGRDGK
jgi:DNA-3-methyladenine glycosylase I